ncbi:MAG: diguanylate cyclase [Azoarcus sp.]|jgi:diguanylate cyclase (GGDEF)-like protein/PAS domain S-box-containing protein|nr:diguanylate cyclase [Azoarcus sp.]
MKPRFRYLTADIAFAAVLIVCLALAALAFVHQTHSETRYQSSVRFSIAERDTASIVRDTGQLLQDIDGKLAALLDNLSNKRMRKDIFQHVLDSAPSLRSISLVDPQGKILSSTAASNVDRVFAPSPWLPPSPPPGDWLRIGPAHAGRDLADGMPLSDNGKATPDPGFIPIVHDRSAAGGKREILVATLDLAYLLRQAADIVATSSARVSLLRADGLRLYDTRPADAGLLMIEREISKNWQRGKTAVVQELKAIDDRQWIVAYALHPTLPFGVTWAIDRDELIADARHSMQRNDMTVLLLILAGMACALFGYVFFRLSNRRERERHLQAEAKRHLLESTLNACASAIIITRPNGAIEWANPAYSSLTGYDIAESIGRNPRDLTKSGIQGKGFYAHMWQTINSGQVWRGELVNRRKDGELYDEFLTISPAMDANGVIQHFIATKEDFTKRKADREELEVAHSHLNAVVENFPGALVMEDTFGRIVLINQSIFELLGLPGNNDYILGRPIYQLMIFSSQVAEDSKAFMNRIEELRTAARPVFGEEIIFGDGRWIERDFIPIRLHDKLIGFLYIYRDISQKKRHARELWQLATSDPLTGIPNRRTFFEQIERERARLARYPGEAAILMIDIDHFKQINDTHGHAVGDVMLCHIVRQIRKLLREPDTLARLGGEEFALLLPETNQEGALGLAERVRKVLEETPLSHNGAQINVTASVGVTIMTPQDINTDHALSRADRALYEAKRNGRNRVELALVDPEGTA